LEESGNLRERLKIKGIEFERHLILRKSGKPYVNSKTFLDCVKSTFISHVMKVHVEKGIKEREVVLLMNNCSYYIMPGVIDLLTCAA
jgi:hypothetical protein